jgi:hypothetical protein
LRQRHTVVGSGARPASCAPVLANSAANANTTATAPRAADLLFEGIMLLGVIMDCAIAFVFFERRTVALFADYASIFDVNRSVGEAQYTRGRLRRPTLRARDPCPAAATCLRMPGS